MLSSVTIIVFCFCVMFAEGTTDEKLEEIVNRYNLSRANGGYGEENIDRHSNMMTAKFNIDGEEKTLSVVKNWLLLYTGETDFYWVKAETVQIVLHYVDGNTPIKVTQLHDDGKLSVQYLGSLSDKVCSALNCQFEIIQPVGAVMKKELLDVTGWAVLNTITSPYLTDKSGLVFTHDGELRCRLD
ncbi:hypothetical protein LOTGIDRAFT_157109 [Lottia gigantea]|uniref:Lipocalin/cytosolic fatty-acid binding domain-containing protein n=1 Tax=Lottia gigantea TaxID=225164 RepID=V4CII5_LOTGI|nr:hypothetical protein LOTGIDRAFT_157109 [Lottia gigantea]ESP01975.1 hypothetical protein LOTGIDRAFT_157109 [Lottia gigantea]